MGYLGTGAVRLDVALRGGLRPGITVICGEAASGKTSLASSAVRRAASLGLTPAYVSTQGAPEAAWVAGSDLAESVVSVESHGGFRAALAALECLKAGCGLVVVDTAETGFASDVEIGLGEADDEFLLESARAHAASLRDAFYALSGYAERSGKFVILVVDVRADLKHRGRLRPNLPPSAMPPVDTVLVLKRGRSESGIDGKSTLDVHVKVQRCRHAPPGREADFRVWPGSGVDKHYEMLRHLESTGALVRAGAYWKSEELGLSLGPGLLRAVAQLREGVGASSAASGG